MLSPKRISLLLAATVFASLVVVIIATTYGEGQTTTSTDGSKIKVLRRKGQHNVGPTAAEIDSARRQNAAQQNKQEERELEDTTPAHVPIKTKIRAEKEKLVKDPNNSQWVRDLELEVTNTSKKPIYFLELWVVLPESVNASGHPDGFSLRYGRIEFVDFNTIALSTDIPIQPGETYTFKIPEQDQRGWQKHKVRENRQDPKKLQLVFVQLAFGDGSGFNGTDAKPYPYIRNQTSSAASEKDSPNKSDSGNTRTRFRDFRYITFSSRPAAFVPVSFSLEDTSYSNPSELGQSGLSCPGTDCYFHKNGFYNCACKRARGTQPAASSDPSGSCSMDSFIDTWCDDLGEACPETIVSACGTATPTPTPEPSPSPTPPPSPTPTPCPAGSFDPDSAGNCPLNSNKINGCCQCQQRNTDCSRFGQGDQCIWVEDLCDCYNYLGRCADNPLPSPTPTPSANLQPGGSGSGDPSKSGSSCTEYDWVLYNYVNGSWVEVARWYAGCF